MLWSAHRDMTLKADISDYTVAPIMMVVHQHIKYSITFKFK